MITIYSGRNEKKIGKDTKKVFFGFHDHPCSNQSSIMTVCISKLCIVDGFIVKKKKKWNHDKEPSHHPSQVATWNILFNFILISL